MCGPAIGMIGAAVSAIGSIASGMAAKAQADYAAKVNEQNAAAAMGEAFAQSGAQRDQFQEVASAQRAALAKAGVDINLGTSGVLALETQRREEVASAVSIWRGRTEQTKYLNQAQANKAEGKAAMMSGFLGAATSLVGSIADIGGGLGGRTASPLGLGQAPQPVIGASNTPIPRPKPRRAGVIPLSPGDYMPGGFIPGGI